MPSGGIWQCPETFFIALLGWVLQAFSGQTTVVASQQRITQSQMSVEDEKVCFKVTIVVACVLCAGSLGVTHSVACNTFKHLKFYKASKFLLYAYRQGQGFTENLGLGNTLSGIKYILKPLSK